MANFKIPKKSPKKNTEVPKDSTSSTDPKPIVVTPTILNTPKNTLPKRPSSTTDEKLPDKKPKLELETARPEPSSMFSGILAVGKYIVLKAFGQKQDSPPDNPSSVKEDTTFQFNPRNEITKSPVFRFTAGAERQLSVDSAIQSPTPANDRLARLRQNLAKNQEKESSSRPIIISGSVADLNDDVVMTDDEDNVQSNVTDDSDDGIFVFKLFPKVCIICTYFSFLHREYGLGRVPCRR